MAAVVAAVALVASLVVPAGPTAAAAGSFTISPTQGPPGTIVQIAGSCGFAAGTVSYGVFGEPSTFHFFLPVAGADGTFTGQLVIPATAPPGSKWPINVTCDLTKPTKADLGDIVFTVVPTGSATLAPADMAVKVANLPALIPGFWIDPQSGPVGTTITITGFCGYPAATLSYSLTYPDETGPPIPSVYVLAEKLPASALGEFTVQLKVPAEGLTIPQYPGPNPVLTGIHHVNVSCDYMSGTGKPVELPRRDFEVTAKTAKRANPGWVDGAFRKVWFGSTGVFVTAELPFATADRRRARDRDGPQTESPEPDHHHDHDCAVRTARPVPAPGPAQRRSPPTAAVLRRGARPGVAGATSSWCCPTRTRRRSRGPTVTRAPPTPS